MITRYYKQEIPIHDKNGVIGQRIYDMPEGQIIHITFEPGSTLPAHKTPVNVAMYVLEGEPTIQIGEEKRVCPAGTLVESPKDISHAIFNPSEEIVRLLVMKLPRPEK